MRAETVPYTWESGWRGGGDPPLHLGSRPAPCADSPLHLGRGVARWRRPSPTPGDWGRKPAETFPYTGQATPQHHVDLPLRLESALALRRRSSSRPMTPGRDLRRLASTTRQRDEAPDTRLTDTLVTDHPRSTWSLSPTPGTWTATRTSLMWCRDPRPLREDANAQDL